ncbi:MAG: YggT family protein [Candidatus Gracilibacteria bacterium]
MEYQENRTSQIRPLFRGTQVVWYVLGLIESLLLLRFVLKLLDANDAAGFTRFIYDTSGVLAAPFLAVFPANSVSGSVLEWSTLLAMLIYWLVAWAIVKLILMARPVNTIEAKQKLDEQE